MRDLVYGSLGHGCFCIGFSEYITTLIRGWSPFGLDTGNGVGQL